MKSETKMVHVTEVLSILDRGYAQVPSGVLKRAQILGIEVHRYSLGWVMAEKNLPILPPEGVAGYVREFQVWFENVVEEVLLLEGRPAVEWPFELPGPGLRGRLDMVARLRGDNCWSVIDLKRVFHVSGVVGLQLAAYRYCFERATGKRIGRGFALHIPPSGVCRAVEFPDYTRDLAAFWQAYQLYRYLKGVG